MERGHFHLPRDGKFSEVILLNARNHGPFTVFSTDSCPAFGQIPGKRDCLFRRKECLGNRGKKETNSHNI